MPGFSANTPFISSRLISAADPEHDRFHSAFTAAFKVGHCLPCPIFFNFTKHPLTSSIFFRRQFQKKAGSYNLTGWVRNTPNEKVEGEAQGEDDLIRKLIKDLGNGPPAAHVVKVEQEDLEVQEGEQGFEVR
ncbi:hypothetical protein MMC22_002105 [Lobaria immixta]|nr:hypothetical protein [Lobaria immixta]